MLIDSLKNFSCFSQIYYIEDPTVAK